MEFDLSFWKLLGQELVDSFNYAFEKGEMPISQRRGIITLIPKKGKNRTLLDNWRRISLLNTDYKVSTKTITARIAKVLPSLIHEDQTGYIKGRFIGENIRGRCFDTVFRRPYRYFSIATTEILSMSDRYKIFASH